MPPSPGAGPNPWFNSTRYHLKERLGASSVGTVYLARDGEAGRLVALKVIHGERVSKETVAQLQHEFQVIVPDRQSRPTEKRSQLGRLRRLGQRGRV